MIWRRDLSATAKERAFSLEARGRLIVLLAIALLGLLHLRDPFGGDQALFVVGAEKLHHGAVLYRDFWDLKQPGIYLFYLAAGVLFGFSNTGVHLFELLYFLSFAAVLQATLVPYYRFRWIAIAAPLLVMGTYYATAGVDAMTQVEALVAFPIYASLWFVLEGCRDGRRRYPYFVAAGLIGAWILCLKLMFLPLILAIWLAALLSYAAQLPPQMRPGLYKQSAVLGTSLFACTGVWIAVTAAVCGSGIVWKTFVVDPVQIARVLPPPPIGRLIHSIRLYAASWIGVLLVAAVALRYEKSVKKNPLAVCCLAWVAMGSVVILLQRQSWWPYHLQLLDVPLSLIATFGLETLWSARTSRSYAFAAAVAAIAVIPAAHVIIPKLHAFPADDQSIAETRLLYRPAALPGNIYVCGDPRFYLAAQRSQAVAINGWALELLLPEEWTQLNRQLSSTRPSYIFVSTFYAGIIRRRSVQVARTLHAMYRPIQTDSTGIWYERKKG